MASLLKSNPRKVKNLYQLIEACDYPYAIHIYDGKLLINNAQQKSQFFTESSPSYLEAKLRDYLSYFVQNHEI